MYKKILFATDGSEISQRAAEKIVELHKNWKCEVVVFHSLAHPVINNMILASSAKYGPFYNLECYEEEKSVYTILREAKKFFEDAEVPVEVRLVREYEPDDYIIKYVKDEGFDLVVLGVKGVHSRLKQINIGSVTNKVIKHVSCDVLVVK